MGKTSIQLLCSVQHLSTNSLVQRCVLLVFFGCQLVCISFLPLRLWLCNFPNPALTTAAAAQLNHVTWRQQRHLVKGSCARLCYGRMKRQIMKLPQTPQSQQAPAAADRSEGPRQQNGTDPCWQANHSLRKPCSAQFLDSIGRVTAMLKSHFSLMLAVNCSITLFVPFFSAQCWFLTVNYVNIYTNVAHPAVQFFF